MSAGFKGHWLSDWLRIHGWLSLPDFGTPCRRHALHERTESTHDRNRSFIPHHDTPFAGESAGTLKLTLYMLGLIRLMIPKVLLPATTALGTIHPKGRELGILAGANVVMPNLSPTEVRKDYLLYDNKICTGDESAQCRHCLEMRMKSIGYQVVTDRGDSLNI